MLWDEFMITNSGLLIGKAGFLGGTPDDLFLEAEFPELFPESLFLVLALQFHSSLHWERERNEKVHFPQAQNSRGKPSVKSFPQQRDLDSQT